MFTLILVSGVVLSFLLLPWHIVLKKIILRRKANGPSGPQFFLLGLDGGCWELIEPMMAQGKLPNLEKLVRNGAYGALTAENPFSPPSWATIATGLGAKDHGFSHFTRHMPGKIERVFLNYGMLKFPCFWDVVRSEGRRAGVLRWQSLPQYPRDLVSKAEKIMVMLSLGGIFILRMLRIKSARHLNMSYLEYRLLREDVMADWEMALTEYVLRRKAPHLLAYRVFETDAYQHCFWKYHFPSDYKVDAEGLKRYGPAIDSIYRKVDDFIGKLMNENVLNVMIVSDHGFKGFSCSDEQTMATLYNVDYEKALNKMGWLRFKEDNRSIDWETTKVFWCGDPRFFHEFTINLEGREPHGSVPLGEYEKTKEDFKRDLEAVRFQDTGEPLFSAITLHDGTPYNRHIDFHFLGEVFRLWNNDAFDVFIGDGYKCRFQDESHLERMVVIGSKAYKLGEFLSPSVWSAAHSRQGIFIAYGEHIKPGRLNAISTLDIAPNLLHWMNIAIPGHMTGSVHEQLFQDYFMRRNPPRFTGHSKGPESDEAAITRKEEARIKEDLRDLGYL